MACTDLIPLIGRSLLFIGNECQQWQIADFVNAAHQARALGFEAIVPKKFDGVNRWYADIPSLQAEREAVEAAGCKYVPFGYCYGPAFGADQITAECRLLAELQSACHGVAVADMEAQWNGQVGGAAVFTATIQKLPPGTLIISTWADPSEQNWQQVIHALHPVVDAWWPQAYDNWLAAAATSEFASLGESCVQPTIHVTNAIGPNDPLAIIKQKLAQATGPISVWEYQMAIADPALAKSITSLIASLEGERSMVPTGWKDDGTTLTAPNGIPVVQGFRQFLLSNTWDAANWPLEPEQGANPVEMSNPSVGAGTRQTFRMSMLEWTQARGVFLGWCGQELLKVREELAASGSNGPALSALQQIKTIVAPF